MCSSAVCAPQHKSKLVLRRRLGPGPMGQAHHVRRAAPSEGYYQFLMYAEQRGFPVSYIRRPFGIGPGLSDFRERRKAEVGLRRKPLPRTPVNKPAWRSARVRCVACFKALVAQDTCKRRSLVKRAIFLATAALLAMLVLVPMAEAQVADYLGTNGMATEVEKTMVNGTTMVIYSDGSVEVPPSGGGSTFLLPAATLLLGSGIL